MYSAAGRFLPYFIHILLAQMGLIVNAAILGGIATIVTNIGGAQGIFRNKMEAMAGLVLMVAHICRHSSQLDLLCAYEMAHCDKYP